MVLSPKNGEIKKISPLLIIVVSSKLKPMNYIIIVKYTIYCMLYIYTFKTHIYIYTIVVS
jgi:hypothetical protein